MPRRPLPLSLGLIVALSCLSTTPVLAIVTNTTQGFYNDSLGDLGAPAGLLPWFPAPGTFGGTQNQNFVSAPDLSGASVALGDWLTDPGNLNSNWTFQSIPANWAVNTEVAIVYVFDAGAGMADLTADFGLIDNGIHIWVDGVWKFGARDPEGRAWNDIALGDVGAGSHYIQILLEDSGGATWYFNPSITATAVPEPAAAWLFGSGLLGLMVLGRKRFLRD
jgi:hypothetical protein